MRVFDQVFQIVYQVYSFPNIYCLLLLIYSRNRMNKNINVRIWRCFQRGLSIFAQLFILLPFIVKVWGCFTEALIRPCLVRWLKSETALWIYLQVCIRPSLNFVRFFSTWMRWRTNGLSRVWRVLRSHVCITYFRGRVLKRLMVTLLCQRSF